MHGRDVGHLEAAGDWKVQFGQMEMDDVEVVSAAGDLLDHDEVRRQDIRAAPETERARTGSHPRARRL